MASGRGSRSGPAGQRAGSSDRLGGRFSHRGEPAGQPGWVSSLGQRGWVSSLGQRGWVSWLGVSVAGWVSWLAFSIFSIDFEKNAFYEKNIFSFGQ
jgi:hypothetical protein